MISKVRVTTCHVFWHCAGCAAFHVHARTPGLRYNGSELPAMEVTGPDDAPTFSRYFETGRISAQAFPGLPRCEGSIVDGVIRYAPTCSHEFAGQEVPLPLVDWSTHTVQR